jgi:glycosyltransferase involved in cell wall biosynthesis
MNGPSLQYLLITPAKNEEAFIEFTMQSVVDQTVRPVRWIIIDDGSTDRTSEIVSRYAQDHDWIKLLQLPSRPSRDFAGKADCINAAYTQFEGLHYDILVSLDGDISFQRDYFEFLLQKFAADPYLGIAGTPFSENGETYDYRFSSIEHVSGACQLFRRECFEEIGGYVPIQGGGIDVVAVLSARLKGWRTQTFTEKRSVHHRLMGSANHKDKLVANFNLGKKDYNLGFHPVWEVFRSIYQMTRRPYLTGGCALFLGYVWNVLRRIKRPVTKELMEFQRQDQMRRLRKFLGIRLPSSSAQDARIIAFNKTARKCDSLE